MEKNKIKIYLLYFFTFGVAYFYLKNKAKKIIDIDNKELTLSNEIKIDVLLLIKYLGGKNNINKVDNTISSIKFFLKDMSVVEINNIKKMDVKGFIRGNNYISFIVGDYSHLLKDEINKQIN